MDEVFEAALAICLDRLADGDSPTTCASDFPEFAELPPLLELATSLLSLPRPDVPSSWLPGSRARIVARVKQHG